MDAVVVVAEWRGEPPWKEEGDSERESASWAEGERTPFVAEVDDVSANSARAVECRPDLNRLMIGQKIKQRMDVRQQD